MTVMDYCYQPKTESSGVEGAILRSKLDSIVRHQFSLFDTFAAMKSEYVPPPRPRRRYSIQELLGSATPDSIAQINQATSWVQNDPSVGDEY